MRKKTTHSRFNKFIKGTFCCGWNIKKGNVMKSVEEN